MRSCEEERRSEIRESYWIRLAIFSNIVEIVMSSVIMYLFKILFASKCYHLTRWLGDGL